MTKNYKPWLAALATRAMIFAVLCERKCLRHPLRRPAFINGVGKLKAARTTASKAIGNTQKVYRYDNRFKSIDHAALKKTARRNTAVSGKNQLPKNNPQGRGWAKRSERCVPYGPTASSVLSTLWERSCSHLARGGK